mgnify:FL=1
MKKATMIFAIILLLINLFLATTTHGVLNIISVIFLMIVITTLGYWKL